MFKLKLWYKTPIIEFYCHPEYFDYLPRPVPASKKIPDWFKKVPLTIGNGLRNKYSGAKALTAKKCMPMLDAMSLGFTLPLGGDVNIRTNKDRTLITAGNNESPWAEFHDPAQVGPAFPGAPTAPVKFINRWVIKTAPGYSTLFVPPINHFDNRFTCLSGLVDTDTYAKEVDFPALWHLSNYDDVITAGTPLVTCFPIKREDVSIDIEPRVMSDAEMKYIKKLEDSQLTRSNVYTDELRATRK
jgi:hypothetical protein